MVDHAAAGGHGHGTMPPGVDIFEALKTPALLLRDLCIVACNAACRSLLGSQGDALIGQPLAEWVSPEPTRKAEPDATERGDLDGRRVLLRVPGGGPPVPVDVESSELPGGLTLLLLEDARPARRLGAIVSQLGGVYLRDGGKAMVDLDALYAGLGSVIAPLHWYLTVWETRGGLAWLRHVVSPGEVSPALTVFVRETLGATLRGDEVPHLAQLASMGNSGVLEDVPERIGRVVELRAGPELAREVVRSLTNLGLRRSVWASVEVAEGRRCFVIASSPTVAERDVSVVQLVAAQVGATMQRGEVSAMNARQERLAALGQMAALLAHEVRNPLAVMFQAYSQLRRRVGEAAPVADLMEMVEEEARRLDKLVNDLVGFAGPTRPRVEQVQLWPLVEYGVATLLESCEDAHVVIEPFGELPLMRADPLLFRQAMTHLLTNAADRAGADGDILISAEYVPGRGVGVRVANDGESLSPEVAARVFEPFFTTKATGSGLGLAVVRRLIEDQGGQVRLDTDRPGVSFSMWLPAVE